jgi:acyl carrier protein phosphodiesterase
MNILVHFLLSDRNEEVVVGNVIADFIKGTKIQQFPPGIQKGIEIHKVIDTYSDNHPVVKETWALLQKDFGLYGRVITDIYFDHFLYKHWDEFSDFSFEDDLQFLYDCLQKHTAELPPKVRRMNARIVALEWPLKYTDMAGLYQVFRSMSRRVAFENKFELAVEVLKKEYQRIDGYFLTFYPELRAYIQSISNSKSPKNPKK